MDQKLTREKQSISTTESKQELPSHTSWTFDRLRFIQYHVLPWNSIQVFQVRYDYLIRSNHDVKGGLSGVKVTAFPKLTEYTTLTRTTPVGNLLPEKNRWYH